MGILLKKIVTSQNVLQVTWKNQLTLNAVVMITWTLWKKNPYIFTFVRPKKWASVVSLIVLYILRDQTRKASNKITLTLVQKPTSRRRINPIRPIARRDLLHYTCDLKFPTMSRVLLTLSPRFDDTSNGFNYPPRKLDKIKSGRILRSPSLAASAPKRVRWYVLGGGTCGVVRSARSLFALLCRRPSRVVCRLVIGREFGFSEIPTNPH